MDNYDRITDDLLREYESLFSIEENAPGWAVRKRNFPDELVRPTIPFVGKRYAEQDVKILVYASAENLEEYWKGNDDNWPGDWLDDDVRATNRHRICFDDASMQENKKLPYVHCGPMEDGGLLTAVMYLASKLRNGNVDMPVDFYESIAFGNYGKFSIETEFQAAVRANTSLTHDEIKRMKKTLEYSNIDYAENTDYLKFSHAYVKADIDILNPDYIIMPNMQDDGFINTIKGNAKIIRIYQITPTVINSAVAPNKRNRYCSKYSKRDISELPEAVKMAYESIRRINLEYYKYFFDYLDKVLETELTK